MSEQEDFELGSMDGDIDGDGDGDGTGTAKPLVHALEALLVPKSQNELWLINRVEGLQEMVEEVLVRLAGVERNAQVKEQEWTSKWAALDEALQQEILGRREAEARQKVRNEELERQQRSSKEEEAMAALERKRARVENRAYKALVRMEDRQTMGVFLPWLAAARAKREVERLDELNQTRSEMFDRLAELGASLQADLAEAMEQNDEKQQTGLAETARILDQKLEQTNAVVHEQLEQLDRVMSSAHEELKQQVEQLDSEHQATVKVLDEHREVHTRLHEEHGKVVEAHKEYDQQQGDAVSKVQRFEDLISSLQERLQESQTAQASTSHELTKLQTDVRSLAAVAAEHGTNHAELASKLAADVARIEATLDTKAPSSEFDGWAEQVAKAEEKSVERLQGWLLENLPPEEFSRLQKDVILLHGEVAMVVGAAEDVRQTKVEMDGLAAGVQENVCSLTNQVDQMEMAMEEHIAQAREVMAELTQKVEADRARDDRINAVQDLIKGLDGTLERHRKDAAAELEQVQAALSEVVMSNASALQEKAAAIETVTNQLHSHQIVADEMLARHQAGVHQIAERLRREREARQASIVRAAGVKLRNRLKARAWAGWRWRITEQMRVKNIARKALLRVEQHETSRMILPWLAAARQAQKAAALDRAAETEASLAKHELVSTKQELLSTIDTTMNERMSVQIKAIDERLSTEVVQVFAAEIKALQAEDKQRADGMRRQWLEELEQLEVTLREEFVAVQVAHEEVKQQVKQTVSSHEDIKQHVARTASAAIPSADPQIASQLSALTEQVERQSTQVAKLVDVQAAETRTKRAQDVQLLGMTSQLKNLQSQFDAFTPQFRGLQQTVSQPVKMEVDTAALTEVRIQMRDDLQALRLEKERLFRDIAQLKETQGALQESSAESRQSIQTLYSSLAEVMETKAQTSALKQQQDSLTATVDQISAGMMTVNAQVSAYSKQMDRVRSDAVADCAKETARLRTDMQKLQDEISRSVAANIKLMESEIGRLGTPLSRAEAMRPTVERLVGELAALREALDAVQSTLVDNGSRLQSAETEIEVIRTVESKPSHSSDIIDLQAELVRIKERTSRLERKSEQSETETKETQAALRVQTSRIGKSEQNLVRVDSALRAEIASTQDAIGVLGQQLDEGFSRASQSRNALAAEVDMLQQALSELRISGAELTGKLDFSETKHSELKDEIDVLYAKISEHEDVHRKFEQLHEEHAAVHSRFEELHQEHGNAHAKFEELHERHVAAHSKFEGLHQEHVATHRKFEELHQEHADAHAKFEELHDNHASVHSKFEELHERHVAAHSKFEGLHQEHVATHRKFEELHQEHADTHAKFEELHQEHTNAHAKFEELHDNHASVHSKFEELHQEHANAHAKFEDRHATIHGKLEGLFQETNEAHARFEELHKLKLDVLEEHKKAHAEHQDALRNLVQEHEAAKAHHDVLQNKHSKTADELMNDLQGLAGEVGDLDAKLHRIEEMLRDKAGEQVLQAGLEEMREMITLVESTATSKTQHIIDAMRALEQSVEEASTEVSRTRDVAKADAEQLAAELAAELVQLQKATADVADNIRHSIAEQVDARATDVAKREVLRVQALLSTVMDGMQRLEEAVFTRSPTSPLKADTATGMVSTSTSAPMATMASPVVQRLDSWRSTSMVPTATTSSPEEASRELALRKEIATLQLGE